MILEDASETAEDWLLIGKIFSARVKIGRRHQCHKCDGEIRTRQAIKETPVLVCLTLFCYDSLTYCSSITSLGIYSQSGNYKNTC
jgi:hypothetical protein